MKFDRYGFDYEPSMCLSCGLVQQSRYYHSELLDAFYSNFYREIYDQSGPEELFSLQTRTDKPFQYLITAFPGLNFEDFDVLDAGCGAGGNLAPFKERGARAIGIELDESYVSYARHQGLDVRVNSIQNFQPNRKFDFIILSHVLEHTEPIEVLGTLKHWLKPEGLLYVEVPSLESVIKGAYGFKLQNYFQNAHLIHFNRMHLIFVARAAGYEVIRSNGYIQCLLSIATKPPGPLEPKQLSALLKNSKRIVRFCKIAKIASPFAPIVFLLTRFVNLSGFNQRVREILFPSLG